MNKTTHIEDSEREAEKYLRSSHTLKSWGMPDRCVVAVTDSDTATVVYYHNLNLFTKLQTEIWLHTVFGSKKKKLPGKG